MSRPHGVSSGYGSDDEIGFDSAHRVADDEMGRARLIAQYAAALRQPEVRQRRASSLADDSRAPGSMTHSVSMPALDDLADQHTELRVAPASQAAHWAALEAAREVDDATSPMPSTPQFGAVAEHGCMPKLSVGGTSDASAERGQAMPPSSPVRPGLVAAPATLPFLGRARSEQPKPSVPHRADSSDLLTEAAPSASALAAGMQSARAPPSVGHTPAALRGNSSHGDRLAQLTRGAIPGAVAKSAKSAHPSPAVATAATGSSAPRAQGDWLPVELETAFQRVVISGSAQLSGESQDVAQGFLHALQLRRKHIYEKPTHYWGAFRPDDFHPDKLVYPPDDTPTHGKKTVNRHDSGTHWTYEPSQELRGGDANGSAPTTPSAASAHPGVLDDDFNNTVLFWRRRPMLPFTVFSDETEALPERMVGVAAVMRDGVMTMREVVPARSAVQPEVTNDQPAGVTSVAPSPTASGSHSSSAPTPVHAQSGQGNGQTGAVPGLAPHERVCSGDVPEGMGLGRDLFAPPTFAEYQGDYFHVCRLIHWAPAKSFAWRRLQLLEARYNLHKLLNGERESAACKSVPHRDLYNVRKVDTHVHHSACMTQKHLLRFIKHKLKKRPDTKVIVRDGKELSLSEVFQSLNLTAYDLSIDTLDMHADNTFHRFDRFNLKYNPIGQSRLREIFLKTDNHIQGKFLAEVTQQVFDDLEASKYQLAEYRLSVYGRRRTEWSTLAQWVVRNKLASPNVRWMIQIPRLYEVYKKSGLVNNFQDMLDNIFVPLFKVSLDPRSDPDLHHFLTLVVGFDCVDDESKHESSRDAAVPSPEQWTYDSAPPYYYWVYYLSANLRTLNVLRAQRGMSTFSWRPHSGEAGDVEHLAATFLTAEAVAHGISMRKNPPLQYLYYLAQIGLHMSPLSNNKLFVEYHSNPFHDFFKRGLNVSLSTDDPLLLHFTREPLVEEYCVAAQVWKLSAVDMCEAARNSVLQSGFEHPFKAHFIGQQYALPGPRGNDMSLTNVADIRLQFRLEVLTEEHSVLASALPSPALAPSLTLAPMLPGGVVDSRRVDGTASTDEQRGRVLPLKSPLSPAPPMSQPALVQHHASMPSLVLRK